MGETEQEATARRLAEAVAVREIGIFEHNYATGETWASASFRETLGFAPDEFVSMQVVARLCFPADVPMIQVAMQKSNDPNGDGVFDLVYRVIRTDGKIRWIHGRGGTTFGEVNGQRVPVRGLGTIADVTEQHELKLAVERHERRLTQATITSQVGMFDWDHDPATPEEAIYWSPTFRQMCGFSSDQAPDVDWYLGRVHPSDIERYRLAVSRALDPAIQAPFDIEYRWLHPSGETLWCVGRSTTSFRQKGLEVRPERTVGAVLDITSTRRAAEQLSQRSAILDRTPDIVSIADPELRLAFLNQAGRSFAGLAFDRDIAGIPLAAIVGESFDAQFTREGRAIAVEVGSWQTEAEFVDHSGIARPVSALVLSHWDMHGQLAHFSLVARDLSREKELAQQMRRAQKLEVIGRLAGGVAHDFNNILSVILGFSEALEDCVTDDSHGRRDLQEIRFAVERAAALTRQLLSISKNELVQPRAIDFNAVLKAAGPMFRRLLDARIDMRFTLSETPVHIKADPSQIEQVLLNLVVNARDAMPAGGTLNLEVSQVLHRPELAPPGLDLKPGPYVVLGVSDSGHGIPADVRDRIFEPFFTTKDQGKGTGLGLATVLGIVEKCGGGVWLHSELNKGTTFKIYFPSTDAPPDVPFDGPSSPILHRGGTILLVEDEAQLRAMLTTVLEQAGYQVLVASGPVEALGLAQGHPEVIDLLLTDVVMPQMTGPALAAELHERDPGLVVLFMSGFTDDAALRSGFLDGHINFLPKPLSASVLLRKIGKLLAGRGSFVA